MLETLFNQAIAWVFDAGISIIVGILILLIGIKVIKKVRNVLDRAMEKSGVETTLRKFLNALVYAILTGVLIFVVAGEIVEIM